MSTGGGWQDQVGGLTEGIKLISTKPGIAQNLVVEKIEMPEEGTERTFCIDLYWSETSCKKSAA